MVEAVTQQGIMVLDPEELSALLTEHRQLTAIYPIRPWTQQELNRIKQLNRILDSQEAHL